uniref:Three-finger toxin n=1 Tax=Philothamnus irregularis TaxID=1899461 RepID=A0A2Z4N9X7_9SAUR|nr:three-finger toxin [Boiga irregularis]
MLLLYFQRLLSSYQTTYYNYHVDANDRS